MKPGIHPDYKQVTASCVCGNTFQTGTTKGSDIRTEICAACHPFYTGTQKIVDTEGRVERFRKKMEQSARFQGSGTGTVKKAAPAPAPAAAAAPAPAPAPAEEAPAEQG